MDELTRPMEPDAFGAEQDAESMADRAEPPNCRRASAAMAGSG